MHDVCLALPVTKISKDGEALAVPILRDHNVAFKAGDGRESPQGIRDAVCIPELPAQGERYFMMSVGSLVCSFGLRDGAEIVLCDGDAPGIADCRPDLQCLNE